MHAPLSDLEEQIGKAIVNAVYKIHKELGPSLLEKIYEICLIHEFRKAGYSVERQKIIQVHYDGMIFDDALRLDILVEKKVVAEIKAVNEVNKVWTAQVLSQLQLSNLRLGYLINFHVPLIKDGIKRLVL